MGTVAGANRNAHQDPSDYGVHYEQSDNWFNLCGAAKYLTKSERYMRQLVADRKITYYKHNRLLAFKKSDLDAWATADCREALK